MKNFHANLLSSLYLLQFRVLVLNYLCHRRMACIWFYLANDNESLYTPLTLLLCLLLLLLFKRFLVPFLVGLNRDHDPLGLKYFARFWYVKIITELLLNPLFICFITYVFLWLKGHKGYKQFLKIPGSLKYRYYGRRLFSILISFYIETL